MLLNFLINRDNEDEKKKKSTADEKLKSSSLELVTRWKLNRTEGYEKQRRQMLPNYEWNDLYGIDEEFSSDEDDNSDSSSDSSATGVLLKAAFGSHS